MIEPIPAQPLLIDTAWKGLCSYEEGLRLQSVKHKELLNSSHQALLLGLEHHAVVTLGVRGSHQADLPLGVSALKAQGVSLCKVRRGGEATLHSPGQLVIYPLVPLRQQRLGVRDFVCGLEKVTQSCLRRFGLESHTQAGEPGLFTKKGKVAFFGIRVERGISTHGLSININNDLQLFDLIRSCGHLGQPHDRLGHYVNVGIEDVFKVWVEEFCARFST